MIPAEIERKQGFFRNIITSLVHIFSCRDLICTLQKCTVFDEQNALEV